MISGTFLVGETIKQENTNAQGYVLSQDGTTVSISKLLGTFSTDGVDTVTGNQSGATAIITAATEKPIIDHSGELIYVENIDTIQRSASSSEKIKLVIKF